MVALGSHNTTFFRLWSRVTAEPASGSKQTQKSMRKLADIASFGLDYPDEILTNSPNPNQQTHWSQIHVICRKVQLIRN